MKDIMKEKVLRKLEEEGIDYYELTFGNSALMVAPGIGCNPFSLLLDGQSVLAGNETPEALRANDSSRGQFLWPFPNRVDQATYQFEGKEYHLDKTEEARGHALHGLGKDKAFQLLSQADMEDASCVTFGTRLSADEFPGYPFDLEMEITFSLSASGLHITMRGKNIGTGNAPYGVGWHPYPKMDKRVDECMLHIPAENEMVMREDLIPTGNLIPNQFGNTPKVVGGTEFDTCFTNLTGDRVRFGNVELYWEGGIGYIQLYTPGDRESLAIEPMSCAPDAFNNGMGLIVLSPGQSIEHVFGIRYN